MSSLADRLSAALPPSVTRLRRRAGKLRKTRMMVRDLRRQVTAQGIRLDRVARRTADVEVTARRLARRLKSAEADLAAARSEVRRLGTAFEPMEQAAGLRALEHGRFAVQVGAVEERIGAVEQRLSDGRIVGDEAEVAQARNVLDEVRREHAQVRAELQIVAAFEERLRRVEASLADLYEGDDRHPV
jgi:chromosome segregation ATPase